MGLRWVTNRLKVKDKVFQEEKIALPKPEHSHMIPVSVEKYAY